MRLQVDLTGSSDARDELEYLQDARQAVHDLLLPDGDLDRAARERLCILLTVLATLERASQTASQPAPPDDSIPSLTQRS